MVFFNKFTVSHFIWYLVPGLGFLFFLFFPLVVFSPATAIQIFNSLGAAGLTMLGIVFGFILEGLRLYRFRVHYSTIRTEFFANVQNSIGANLNAYFILSHISDVANEKKYTGLNLSHAIWIMIGHFTIISFLESVFWFIAAIVTWIITIPCISTYFNLPPTIPYKIFSLPVNMETTIVFCILLSILFFVFFLRFNYISVEEQKTTNSKYLDFAKQHRKELREFLNLPPDRTETPKKSNHQQ
jgi:hypothetical protein